MMAKRYKLLQCKANDWEIYRFCLGDVAVGEKIFSPYGENGRTKNFQLFESDNVDIDGYPVILWSNFRTGDTGNAIKLLMLINNVSYKVAVQFANEHIAGKDISGKKGLDFRDKPDMVCEAFDELQQPLIDYYAQFHISPDKLEREGIKSTRKASFGSYSAWYHRDDKPMCHWTIGLGTKLYNPLAEERLNKWRSVGVPDNEIDGMDFLLPHQEIIFVTSSRKDRLVSDDFVSVVNPHGSETHFTPWETAIPVLRGRCNKLVFVYDGDEAGTDAAQRIVTEANTEGVGYVDTRPYYDRIMQAKNVEGLKDPAELSFNFGPNAVYWLYNQIWNDLS